MVAAFAWNFISRCCNLFCAQCVTEFAKHQDTFQALSCYLSEANSLWKCILSLLCNSIHSGFCLLSQSFSSLLKSGPSPCPLTAGAFCSHLALLPPISPLSALQLIIDTRQIPLRRSWLHWAPGLYNTLKILPTEYSVNTDHTVSGCDLTVSRQTLCPSNSKQMYHL